MLKRFRYAIGNHINSADIFLLVFLLAITYDSVVVKMLTVPIAISLLFKKIQFQDFRQAPLFYILIPAVEIIKFFSLNHNFSQGHIISFLIGIYFWLMCLCCFVIVKNRVVHNERIAIASALQLFFVINVLVSIDNLIMVMWHSGSLNPYNLNIEAYGNSTGDYIKGVMGGPCFLNMCANAFFAIYFLYNKRYLFAFVAVVIAVLTSSNFANIIFIPVLVVLLFVLKERKAKYTILFQLLFFVVFYLFISKGNSAYVFSSFAPKSNEVADRTRVTPIFTPNRTTNVDTANMKKISFESTYGKKISFEETYQYLLSSPVHFLFGAGIGNFSSLLASRTADLPIRKSRLFQKLPLYMAPEFEQNHYGILYQLYRLPPGYHSIKHTPNSFWNQIFGEYGVVGFLLFLFFYVGFFLKRWRQFSYTWGMAVILGGFLFFDYLFEYLSVVVLFELFFLTDMSNVSIKGQSDEG